MDAEVGFQPLVGIVVYVAQGEFPGLAQQVLSLLNVSSPLEALGAGLRPDWASPNPQSLGSGPSLHTSIILKVASG